MARVRGVILRVYSLGGPLAALQSLRDGIDELRAKGKRVVVWAHSYGMAEYYVACAADEILLQHGGHVAAVGLAQTYVYLADALERIGLEADIVQITPYKTAGDLLTRRSMSDAAREMANWLIDDAYAQHLQGIAAGRGLSEEASRELIDGAPYVGQAAVDAGAVDAILGEEELPAHLGRDRKPVRLADYDEAKRRLIQALPDRPGRAIAILRIAGDIVDGRSANPLVKPPFRIPLLFGERAGDLTVVQQARALERNRRVGAVVVHVDSGGGSASASEAMAGALRALARKKPVAVAMGGVAASGGYYVATPGAHVLAHPGTITGSIGVLGGKLVNAGLYEKLLWHREVLHRGDHATLFSASRAFTDEERRNVWREISETYELFLRRVTEARDMPRDAVDAVGGGRVWTGRQALDRGLVDGLGGLEDAIEWVRKQAKMGRRAAVQVAQPSKKLLAPAPLATADWLSYAADGLRALHRAPLALCPIVCADEPL